MLTISQMFALPQFWLPLAVPLLLGIIPLIFETLRIQPEVRRDVTEPMNSISITNIVVDVRPYVKQKGAPSVVLAFSHY